METQRQEVEPADIIIPQELLPAQPNGHRVVPGVSAGPGRDRGHDTVAAHRPVRQAGSACASAW